MNSLQLPQPCLLFLGDAIASTPRRHSGLRDWAVMRKNLSQVAIDHSRDVQTAWL